MREYKIQYNKIKHSVSFRDTSVQNFVSSPDSAAQITF